MWTVCVSVPSCALYFSVLWICHSSQVSVCFPTCSLVHLGQTGGGHIVAFKLMATAWALCFAHSVLSESTPDVTHTLYHGYKISFNKYSLYIPSDVLLTGLRLVSFAFRPQTNNTGVGLDWLFLHQHAKNKFNKSTLTEDSATFRSICRSWVQNKDHIKDTWKTCH